MHLTTAGSAALPASARRAVALLSDHPLVVAGVTALLDGAGGGPVVVRPLADAGALLAGAPRRRAAAGVVVVDVTCAACPAGAAAAEVAARLHAAGVAVLALVGPSSAGADGLPPGVARCGLCASSEEVVEALRVAGLRSAGAGPAAPRPGAAGQGAPRLSARERQVLALYARDLPAKSVARRLRVTEGTVKEYLNRVRDKLEAAGRAGRTKLQLRDAAEAMGLLED